MRFNNSLNISIVISVALLSYWISLTSANFKGNNCYLNHTTDGICQDIGNCPILDHLFAIEDFVFCDISSALVCCPSSSPPVISRPSTGSVDRYKEGDRCTSQTGQSGTCLRSIYCTNDKYKPLDRRRFSYCDHNRQMVCCPSLESTTRRPSIQGTGDICTLSTGKKGICLEISVCTEFLNVVALSNAEYCHEPTLLVCCSSEKDSKNLPDIAMVTVSPPDVRFDCGDSYPEPVLRTNQRIDLRRRAPTEDISKKWLFHSNSAEERNLGFRDVVRTVSIKYMALIGLRDSRNYINWICNGALINERWIIAAAHCFLIGKIRWRSYPDVNDELWRSVVVRLGEYDFRKESHWTSPVDFNIVKSIPYPDYVPYEGYHDLVLVKLDRSVLLGRYINPVCLPWGTFSKKNIDGLRVTRSGWGASTADGVPLSHLHHSELTVYPYTKCDRRYSKESNFDTLFPNAIGKDTICAGDPRPNEMVCQGNYGAHISYLDHQKRYVLFGVEFQSYGCDTAQDPGLFVNLQMTPYLSWIKRVAFSGHLAPKH